MSNSLSGKLYINGVDAYATYGAFLSADRRGEFKNLSALLKPPTMKPYVAVSFREQDGEQLPEVLPTPAIEARDIDLQLVIVASSPTEYLRRYAAFVKVLRSGWLELRVPELPGKTFRVYYKSSTECTQLTPFSGGTVAGKFKVKFREPKPAI
jgi:hypothetical protein